MAPQTPESRTRLGAVLSLSLLCMANCAHSVSSSLGARGVAFTTAVPVSSPVAPLMSKDRMKTKPDHSAQRILFGQNWQMVASDDPIEKERVPITLLSGFLGSGKTTLLKEALDNKGGLKVGVVVNDIAAVNIDSKLVKTNGLRAEVEAESVATHVDVSDVMELQNGCACCSSSDELFQSVLKLLTVGARRGEQFDRIVVELTGVAEPKSMRRQFVDMEMQDHPALELAALQNMVTVVDAANFLASYQTKDAVFERRELLDRSDVSEQSLGRKVVDLLTEQVEVADYVILNKQDKVQPSELQRLESIVASLNPSAERIITSYGKVDLGVVLGSDRAWWVADLDDEDDLRLSVRNAAKKRNYNRMEPTAYTEEQEGEHAHTHSHSDEATSSHAHGHAHADAHSHSHSHSDVDGQDHAHSHDHPDPNSPQAKFGISSFVYSRRRPFSAARLRSVIAELPVSLGGEEASEGAWAIPQGEGQGESSPLQRVIRSKGFVWTEDQHTLALYWSQAGQHFDMAEFGLYWAVTPLKYWPQDPEQRGQVVADFAVGSPWGDRRQELVFIGVALDQPAIEARLDHCLLTDQEMAEYAAAASAQTDAVRVDFAAHPPLPISLQATMPLNRKTPDSA